MRRENRRLKKEENLVIRKMCVNIHHMLVTLVESWNSDADNDAGNINERYEEYLDGVYEAESEWNEDGEEK